jgi:hypothetical protein
VAFFDQGFGVDGASVAAASAAAKANKIKLLEILRAIEPIATYPSPIKLFMGICHKRPSPCKEQFSEIKSPPEEIWRAKSNMPRG